MIAIVYHHHTLLMMDSETRKASDHPSSSSLTINDLPNSILIEILIRLPIKTIIHSESVSKSWYKLISSQEFTSSYLSNHPFLTFLLSLSKPTPHNPPPSLSLLEIATDGNHVIHTPLSLSHSHIPNIEDLSVIGCCNGYICLVNSPQLKLTKVCFKNPLNEVVYVVNPLSGNYVSLPLRVLSPRTEQVYCGFGFDASSNCYKVVRISRMEDGNRMQCEIFTVWKDVAWRSIDVSEIPKVLYSRGVSANGFVNWVGQDRLENCIFAIDVGEERFRRMLIPSKIDQAIKNKFDMVDLEFVQWDGNLCLVDFTSGDEIEMWTMKEYGVAESWTKVVVLWGWIPSNLPSYSFIPITTLRNGEILMCDLECGNLISFDQERKQFYKVEVYWF